MTKVTYFEDFHCVEYHTPQDVPQRFHYYIFSPAYERPLRFPMFLTQAGHACEKTVYSSDFLPSRMARRWSER